MIVPNTDPLLNDAVAARLLSGLSGACVYLMTKDGRHWFVRKGAAQPAASDRLRRQAAKQRNWHDRGDAHFRTPRILDEGCVDDRYYFDMEVVRGVDGATYLRSADYASVRRLADRLCNQVELSAAEAPAYRTNDDDLFTALFARVCSVQATTSRIAADDLAAVFVGLERIRARGLTAPTLCHGDLTLENLFVDDHGDVWAFDLLDAPFEHYWQDIAKLQQDLEGGWYLRNRPAIARCVTEYVGRRLHETAVRLDPAYAEIHPVLMAATFIRILPYVPDEAAARFVQERVAYYADRLRRGPTTH